MKASMNYNDEFFCYFDRRATVRLNTSGVAASPRLQELVRSRLTPGNEWSNKTIAYYLLSMTHYFSPDAKEHIPAILGILSDFFPQCPSLFMMIKTQAI